MFIVVAHNQDPAGGGAPYQIVFSSLHKSLARDWINQQKYNGPPGWEPRYDIFERIDSDVQRI